MKNHLENLFESELIKEINEIATPRMIHHMHKV